MSGQQDSKTAETKFQIVGSIPYYIAMKKSRPFWIGTFHGRGLRMITEHGVV